MAGPGHVRCLCVAGPGHVRFLCVAGAGPGL